MIGVSDSHAALDGVSVLDLATYLAAPLCATLLGEFGAEVIKVEQPRVGDDLRRLGRAVAPAAGGSYWWFVEARNKKSITCNLRDPEGQALIRRLVVGSHVVTENFRPGTLERDRKSTRLNSSHSQISYAVFCLKKKKKGRIRAPGGMQ